MSLRDDESTSDDEVFFGKLSLKELKHMFCIHQNNGQTIATNEQLENDNHNMSLKLTHSEPDITSKHKGDASPENIPKSLSNTPLSPDQPNLFAIWDTSSMEFDNTLEEIEYILNNPPKAEKKNTDNNFHKEAELEGNQIPIQVTKEKVTLNAKPSAVVTSMKQVQKEKEVFAASSSVQHKKEKVTLNAKPSAVVTSMKQVQKEKEVFATSSSVRHTKPALCITPANPTVFKKPSPSTSKKTPRKNNAFLHIASPVAYYINNSPKIPLIQNVFPKKILRGLSSIPKLVKSSVSKPSNKENVNLPSVAYKSAKKTTVIDVSNAPKMPESQWAKKLIKTLPRPAVIKHTHREKDFANKQLQRNPEDSFGDLSLHQADVSVCTKKTAF